MTKPFVPPGGVASASQQTPAGKAGMGLLRTVKTKSQRRGTKAAKRYARNKRTISGKTRKKRASSGGKPARLVKGSPAAKAYMAKIRRKRRK